MHIYEEKDNYDLTEMIGSRITEQNYSLFFLAWSEQMAHTDTEQILVKWGV